MPWPDDYILYSISVEDIRRVAKEEHFRELTDAEIKQIGDKLGDYIGWYDAALMAIGEVAPDAANTKEEDDE
ncbi:MAG: hypothetical protein Q7S51_03300 [Gallionellaceae bacterium]|nr:hypothetical protein [Gallionellaceae bacterium]